MRARYTWGLSLAAALTMAAGAGAQSPNPGPGSASEDARTPSTTQSTTADDKSTPASTETAGSVTVVGCVQKERDVFSTRGLGTGDEFVLTNVGKESADQKDQDKAESGAAAAAAQGGMYALTGDREDELESMVGKRVEIIGRLEHPDESGTAAAAASPDAAGSSDAAAETETADASGADRPAATSGDDEQPVGTSGAAADSADEDEDAPAHNTGSTLGQNPAYEGSRSPEEQQGIQARHRVESLPEIEITSFRAVGGDCGR